MEQYKVTPTTKLKKDREFLGAFADQILFSEAKQPAQPVVFKSSSQQNNQANSKRLPQKDFSAFYKKKGVAAVQGVEGSREARAGLDKNRRKDRRTEIMMSRRGITQEPPISLVQKNISGSSTNVNQNALAASRKEQLQRWKLQKEKATEAAERKAKPKPVPQATKLMPPPAPVTRIRNINAPAPALTRRPPMPTKLPTSTSAKPGERRVTRAMAKATAPGQASMQPAIAKMKNLTLNPKLKKAVSVENVTPTKPKEVAIANRGRKTEDMQPMHSYESGGTEATQEAAKIEAPVVKVKDPAPPAAPPKKKVMGLDRVYMDYNQKLVEACTALMTHSDHWRAKLGNTEIEIPEDVISDIESVLGAAKLLMDSKLPQFVQLLYYYLSKETNPQAILPCDLQGWWDVASIQVEKVKARFTELTGIEQNAWQPICPSPQVKQVKTVKPMQNSASSSSETAQATKPKPKPQASSGLRAFLANKRKVASADPVLENESPPPAVSSPAPVKGSKTPSPPLSAKNESPTKDFEGGFFQISSPLRSSNKSPGCIYSPRPSALSIRAYSKTPVQRRTSNAALATLALRKSMGPFCRIGAVSPEALSCAQPEDEIQNMPRHEESNLKRVQERRGYSPSYSDCVRHSGLPDTPGNATVIPDQYKLMNNEPEPGSVTHSAESVDIPKRHYSMPSSPSAGIKSDSETEFHVISHNSNYDNRRYDSKNTSSSSSSPPGPTTESEDDPGSDYSHVKFQNYESKCTFSRSFHHFMETATNRDRGKLNALKTKSRRKKSETVKFKWKPNPNNSCCEKLKVKNDIPTQAIHGEPFSKPKRNPGVIGDGRHKHAGSPVGRNSKYSRCHYCNLRGKSSLDCNCRANHYSREGYCSSAEPGPQKGNSINSAVQSLEKQLFGEAFPQETVEGPFWSPFCYDELGLFDNPQLKSELRSIYPDWPQDFVVIPDLTSYHQQENTRFNSNHCDYRTKHISFKKGDVGPDPPSYCEIFGAQNVLDCNPEYSPFHDPPLSLVDSLILQQQQKPKSSWPICRSSLHNHPSCYTPTFWNDRISKGRSKTTPWKQSERTSQVSSPGAEAELSCDNSNSTSTFQCDICDIYRIIRKKGNKFPCSSDRVNVSAECTYCGRFTDVTPRRSTRMSVAQSSVPRSTGGNLPSCDSASD